MTLFTAVHHLPGSMRSLAISKLPQSTNVCGKKNNNWNMKKQNKKTQKNNKAKTIKLTRHFLIPATLQFNELHFTFFSVVFPLQVQTFHRGQ